jgi:hypothetical protein
MTPDTGKNVADRFIAALRRIEKEGPGAVEPMVALFDDSATLANAALDHTGAEREGREGVRSFWTGYADAFTGAVTDFSHVTVGPDSIGLFWVTTGGTASFGRPAPTYAGATLIEHDANGKITHFRGYYDTAALKVLVGGDAP